MHGTRHSAPSKRSHARHRGRSTVQREPPCPCPRPSTTVSGCWLLLPMVFHLFAIPSIAPRRHFQPPFRSSPALTGLLLNRKRLLDHASAGLAISEDGGGHEPSFLPPPDHGPSRPLPVQSFAAFVDLRSRADDICVSAASGSADRGMVWSS
ncbi:hypothetical protein VTI74DRAFT_682 [Chaetomium olivicolor]